MSSPAPASLRLPVPPPTYSAEREVVRNGIIERADTMNRKRGQDLEVSGSERLILSSPNGTRWKLTVSNAGVLTATSL